MKKNKTALKILQEARAKISDPHDWGKGLRYAVRPGETCCAAEAIEECCSNLDAHHSTKRAAIRVLVNVIGLPEGMRLTQWNDAPERTHAEVLAVFDHAIAIMRLS